MNKQDLITKVSEVAGLTKKDTGKAIDALLNVIQNELNSGEKIQIVGFGSFEVRDRAARKGTNPSTGETIDIPACRVPFFKPGKAFKDAVN